MTTRYDSIGQDNNGDPANSEPFTVSGTVMSASGNESLIGVNIIEVNASATAIYGSAAANPGDSLWPGWVWSMTGFKNIIPE